MSFFAYKQITKKIVYRVVFWRKSETAMTAKQFYLTIAAGVITALIIKGVESKAEPEPETEQGGLWGWLPWD